MAHSGMRFGTWLRLRAHLIGRVLDGLHASLWARGTVRTTATRTAPPRLRRASKAQPFPFPPPRPRRRRGFAHVRSVSTGVLPPRGGRTRRCPTRPSPRLAGSAGARCRCTRGRSIRS
eukprot:4523534-Prymnesium_polylepis.2